VNTGPLARLCGIDRQADFSAGRRPHTEREEAELLLSTSPDFEAEPWLAALATARWFGPASLIDPHPLYQWPQMEAVTLATRGLVPPTPEIALDAPFAPSLLLRRRSAQRFDPRHTLSLDAFVRILAATRPEGPSDLHLLLFIHRVADRAPGVYLLPRHAEGAALVSYLNHLTLPVLAVPGVGPLLQVVAADPKKLQVTARSLHCHQDLASTGSFSLGMVSRFAAPLADTPARYRTLFREAGNVGQSLYLAAEREGVAGCGIGCFFDDSVHRLLNLPDESFQTLYHFAVGLPVADPRIETLPPYTHLAHLSQ
jgi:hypothetical protein